MVNTTMRTHPLPILATLLASSSIGGVHAANYYGHDGYLATQQLHLQLPQQRQQQQLQLRHSQPQQQVQLQRQTQKQQQSSQTQLLFCGQCIWKNTMVCDFRADFLLNNYDDITTLEEAQQGILDAGNTQCSSVDGNPPKTSGAAGGGGGVGKIVNLDLFCNTCPWKSAGFNCEARVGYLQSAWKLTQKSAQESLLEKGDCIDPTWNGTDVYIDDPDYVPGEENLFDLDNANNNGGGDNQGGVGQGGGGGGEVIEDIILFCSSCPYPNSPDTTCEEAAQALANENNDMSLEEAKVSILQECFRDPDDGQDEAETDAVEMEEESNSLSAGGIVGIVFALLLILAIIIICLVCARRRRKRLQEEDDQKVGESTEVVEKDVENPEAANDEAGPMVVQAVPVPSKEEEEAKVPPPECAPEEEEEQVVRPDPPALGEDEYGTIAVGDNDDSTNNVGRSTDPPEARSVEDIIARYANGNNSVDDERGSDVGVGEDEEVVPIIKDSSAEEQSTENAATPADENVGSEGEQEGIVTAENSATENQGGNANEEIKQPSANDHDCAIETQDAPQSSSSPNDDPHTLAASSGDSLNTEILNTQSHVGEIYVINQSQEMEPKQSLNIAPVVAMEEQLAAPRPLSESETSTLRDMLKSQLILANEDDEEDAENLLDYALGMVESGENVGLITEELKFMEMSICNEEAASKLGICLTKYFRGMNGTPQ